MGAKAVPESAVVRAKGGYVPGWTRTVTGDSVLVAAIFIARRWSRAAGSELKVRGAWPGRADGSTWRTIGVAAVAEAMAVTRTRETARQLCMVSEGRLIAAFSENHFDDSLPPK
jgi:hypothetical protein